MTTKNSTGNEVGLVLVTVLIILGLLSAVAAGTLLSGQLDLRISANLKSRSQAFYVAEAGLHHAWQELGDGDGINDLATVFAATGITTLFSNASFGGGSYSVTAEPITSSRPKRLKLISRACLPAGEPCAAGNAKVIIEAQVRGESMFLCAICGKESVYLSGGANTDSFDSAAAPYDILLPGGDGSIHSNGVITLSGSATQINGSSAAGASVTTTAGATVTGTITNQAPLRRYSPVTPCSPPYSSGAGITGGIYDTYTGELTANPGDAISLSSGSYCFSSIQLAGGSSLTANGPVTVNVTAHSDFSGGDIINTTADAENFKILSSLSSSIQGVTVSGGAQTYIAVYAPDSKIEIVGGGDFFGSIVGAVVESTAGAKFHYDKNLQDNQDGKVVLLTWAELF